MCITSNGTCLDVTGTSTDMLWLVMESVCSLKKYSFFCGPLITDFMFVSGDFCDLCRFFSVLRVCMYVCKYVYVYAHFQFHVCFWWFLHLLHILFFIVMKVCIRICLLPSAFSFCRFLSFFKIVCVLCVRTLFLDPGPSR